MKYQIPEDTLPGARPRLAAPVLTIILTSFFAGALMGMIWAGLNGHYLGCRDMRRQWAILISGLVAVKILGLTGWWLGEVYTPDTYAFLGGEILQSIAILVMMVTMVYIADRQQVLYRLQTRGRWTFWAIPTAVGLIILSILIRGILLAGIPLAQAVIGGILSRSP